MTEGLLLSTLVTLLVTVDPIGLAPVFLSITDGMSAAQRRVVAIRGALIAFAILAFFVLAGARLLDILGIGLPAFRIGGGLLLFWIAFEMVFERRSDRKQQTADDAVRVDHVHDVAAFPLAIPLMAGPGAITAVILEASRTNDDFLGVAMLILLIALVMALSAGMFLLAGRVAGLLGRTGSIVLSRLLGVLLTSLAVQFVADGIRALIRT